MFSVEHVEVIPNYRFLTVEVGFRRETSDLTRMARATVVIDDLGGNRIGQVNVDIDHLRIPRVHGTLWFRTTAMDRLLHLMPSEIDATICVTEVIHRDGMAEEF